MTALNILFYLILGGIVVTLWVTLNERRRNIQHTQEELHELLVEMQSESAIIETEYAALTELSRLKQQSAFLVEPSYNYELYKGEYKNDSLSDSHHIDLIGDGRSKAADRAGSVSNRENGYCDDAQSAIA